MGETGKFSRQPVGAALRQAQDRRAESRDQRSGLKLISDLRLPTSMIDDFNDFYDLTNRRILESTDDYWILATDYWILDER